jgi:hypothetical protein
MAVEMTTNALVVGDAVAGVELEPSSDAHRRARNRERMSIAGPTPLPARLGAATYFFFVARPEFPGRAAAALRRLV